MKNNCLLLFLAILFPFTSFSQQYFFKNYGIDDGVSAEVFDVIQAKDKTLWLATYFGVSNFNGTEFIHYNKSNGLKNNLAKTIFEDSKGRIWVGYYSNGINYIENGKVFTLEEPLLNQQLAGVMQFLETKDGTIWMFATAYIFTYKDGKLSQIYKANSKEGYAFPSNAMQSKDGTIWVATLGRGIAKIKPSPFKIEMINDKNSTINNICYSLYEDKDGSIWIGSYGSIFNYKNNTLTVHKLKGKSHRNRIMSIAEDKEGNFWLGLYGNGFAVYDKKNTFTVVNSKNGLPDDYTLKLIIDSENNKWIASQNNGLTKFRDFAFVYYTEKDGLPNKQINDFETNKGDTLFIATKRGIVNFYNGKFFNPRLKDEYVHAIAFDAKNNLWCSTTKKYGIVNQSLKDHLNKEIFYDIILKKDSTLVFAGEFNLQEIKNNKITIKKVTGLNARDLMLLDDKIIITSLKNLKEYHRNKVKIITDLPASINTFLEITRFSDTEFFAGTLDALIYVKLIDTTYTYKSFSRDRFPGIRGFNSILVDDNTLWVGSSSSLSKIDINSLIKKDSVVVETYGRNIGFIKGESSKAITKINNAIYLGTNNGMLKFSPLKFNKNKTAPQLKIKEVALFSEKLNDSLYLKNNKTILPYNKNHLTFKLSATSLTYPENIKYKYRLKGLRDSKWTKPSFNNKVTYSYLPPGDYTFEFVADNGFGIWQKVPETYSFEILLPFWKTDWFKFWVTAFVLLFGFSYIYFTQRRKKIEQQKFTQSLIKAQEKERKRVSKELHDGVGQNLLLIKNSLQLNPDKTLKLIDKTIEEIRYISRNLHPVQLEKFGLTKALKNIVEDINELTEIFVTEEIENIDNFFPKEKEIYLYRIVQECFNNIIKHSGATAAKITAKKEKNKVTVTIQDNGKGFNFETNQNKKSFGLKSLQERALFLKGKINFETEKNKGTIITLTSYR